MVRAYFLCIVFLSSIFSLNFFPVTACAEVIDLPEIQERGVLRHIGTPYANFITGMGDGLSVELVRRFAEYLGVRYEYVQIPWSLMFSHLTGKNAVCDGKKIHILGNAPLRGDLIATGCTVLPWRKKIVAFSTPTFPTQVWLITRTDSALHPVVPTGDIDTDIVAVKSSLKGARIFVKSEGCLNPVFYHLEKFGAIPVEFKRSPNELAPAVLEHKADATILDVPDALVALRKWPGQVKIIGPVSPPQNMAVAFRKNSPRLRQAFNCFFKKLKERGEYAALVTKYYPDVFLYHPDFFR